MSPNTKRNLGYAMFGIIGVKVLFWSLGPSSHSDNPAPRAPVAVAVASASQPNVPLSQLFGTWSNVACSEQSYTWTETSSTEVVPESWTGS